MHQRCLTARNASGRALGLAHECQLGRLTISRNVRPPVARPERLADDEAQVIHHREVALSDRLLRPVGAGCRCLRIAGDRPPARGSRQDSSPEPSDCCSARASSSAPLRFNNAASVARASGYHGPTSYAFRAAVTASGELAPVGMEVRDRNTCDDQVRVQLEHLLRLLVGLFVPAHRLQIGVQVHPRPHLQRILGNGALGELDGPLGIAFHEQEAAVERPRERSSRPDAPSERRSDARPRPSQSRTGRPRQPSSACASGSESVEPERRLSRCSRRWDGFMWRRHRPKCGIAQPVETQAHVRKAELRIELDRRLVARLGEVPRIRCHFRLVMPGLQIRFIRRAALARSARWRRAGQRDPQSARVIAAAMSSCSAKRSLSSRSYRSLHRCPPSAAAINCAVTRTRSPARRTLPSSTWVTSSASAIRRTSCVLAAKRER